MPAWPGSHGALLLAHTAVAGEGLCVRRRPLKHITSCHMGGSPAMGQSKVWGFPKQPLCPKAVGEEAVCPCSCRLAALVAQPHLPSALTFQTCQVPLRRGPSLYEINSDLSLCISHWFCVSGCRRHNLHFMQEASKAGRTSDVRGLLGHEGAAGRRVAVDWTTVGPASGHLCRRAPPASATVLLSVKSKCQHSWGLGHWCRSQILMNVLDV